MPHGLHLLLQVLPRRHYSGESIGVEIEFQHAPEFVKIAPVVFGGGDMELRQVERLQMGAGREADLQLLASQKKGKKEEINEQFPHF